MGAARQYVSNKVDENIQIQTEILNQVLYLVLRSDHKLGQRLVFILQAPMIQAAMVESLNNPGVNCEKEQ